MKIDDFSIQKKRVEFKDFLKKMDFFLSLIEDFG